MKNSWSYQLTTIIREWNQPGRPPFPLLSCYTAPPPKNPPNVTFLGRVRVQPSVLHCMLIQLAALQGRRPNNEVLIRSSEVSKQGLFLFLQQHDLVTSRPAGWPMESPALAEELCVWCTHVACSSPQAGMDVQ